LEEALMVHPRLSFIRDESSEIVKNLTPEQQRTWHTRLTTNQQFDSDGNLLLQTTLPAALMRELGIEEGDTLRFYLQDGVLKAEIEEWTPPKWLE